MGLSKQLTELDGRASEPRTRSGGPRKNWDSDFGSYTLAVHSDVSKCIVVHHHTDKILVFNLGSDAETSAFLAELQARLP